MLKVTKRAAQFYKKEMELKDGDAVRLYVRYGGQGQYGFSVGIEKSEQNPIQDGTEIEGITFYADPDDRWFVDLLTLDADEKLEDVVLTYAH